MISPKEKYSVLSFVPWLLGMLTCELASIKGDPYIDPHYYNGFKDCLETIKGYTEKYLGGEVWGELEADVKEYMEKGKEKKKAQPRRRELVGVLL